MDVILVRLLFDALLSGVCYFLHPFGASGWMGAAGGALAAGSVIVFELRVRALSLRRLIGAVDRVARREERAGVGVFGNDFTLMQNISVLLQGFDIDVFTGFD